VIQIFIDKDHAPGVEDCRIMKKTYTIVGLTILAFGVGVFVLKPFSKPQVAGEQVQTASPKVTTSESYFDWGDIKINGGVAEKEFEIKNEGEGVLNLSSVVTSCACTTAQLIKDGEASPLFGMHTKSSYIMEVASGESAKLKVVFDPTFHGPSGVGPISRQVFVNTNDPEKSKLTFYVKTVVVRE